MEFGLKRITDGSGDCAVVFIHGILSDGDSCWKHENGSLWPELLASADASRILSIFVYTYQSAIFSADYNLDDVVDDLRQRLRSASVARFPRIVFVCHSLGGIVARRYLIRRQLDRIDPDVATAYGLFLVASPSLGSDWANWLQPIAKFFRHSQAEALRFSKNNRWLDSLDRDFRDLKESRKLELRGREVIEDKFIVLHRFYFLPKVVERISGARYFGDALKIAGTDHFSIANPRGAEAPQHSVLCEPVADMVPNFGGTPAGGSGAHTHEVASHATRSVAVVARDAPLALPLKLRPSRASFRRSELLEQVVDRLLNGPLSVTVLTGLPFIGKTTLMGHAIDSVIGKFERVVPLILDGPAALDPGYVFDALNSALSTFGRALPPAQLGLSDEHKAVDELASRFAGMRVLFAVDGADRAEPAWMSTIIDTLSRLPEARILVTSRKRLMGTNAAHVITVTPLERAEALGMIVHHAELLGMKLDGQKLMQRLPEWIWSAPQALSTVLAGLRDLPLELFDTRVVIEPALAPLTVLQPVLNSIGPDARASLVLLAVLEMVNIAQALSELGCDASASLTSHIPALIANSLIERVDDTYAVPAVVIEALVNFDRAAVEGQLEPVVTSVAGRLASVVHPGECSVLLARIAAQCAVVCHRLENWRAIRPLADKTVLDRLNELGHWKEYGLILSVGLEGARRTGNRNGQVALGCRLARKLLQVGSASQARETFAQVTALDDSLLEPGLQAEILSHQAVFRAASGDADGAILDLEKSLRLYTEAGESMGRASVFYLLGMQRLRQRDHQAARSLLGDALVALGVREFGKEHVDIEIGLGECDAAEGEFGRADARLRDALRDCERTSYFAARPRVLVALALVCEGQGRVIEARSLAQEATEAARLSNAPVGRLATMIAARLAASVEYETGVRP